jgi:hypothetical protein
MCNITYFYPYIKNQKINGRILALAARVAKSVQADDWGQISKFSGDFFFFFGVNIKKLDFFISFEIIDSRTPINY